MGFRGSQITPVCAGAYLSPATRTMPYASCGGRRVRTTVGRGCGELRTWVNARAITVRMKRTP